MSLTLKIGSLAIRTLAKPIGNYIKRNAREHDVFRKVCVGFAQKLHRIDMRMRLGLLQDRAVIERQNERQLARDAAAEEAKRKKAETPTVKTQAQTEADEAAADKDKATDKSSKPAKKLPTIRPLSEAKAIESGANFISETFLFVVAGGLIVLERWWANRKEATRREDVAERLASLESEESELKARVGTLQAAMQELKERKESMSTTSMKADEEKKRGHARGTKARL